jgi:hypothetical protein
LREAHTLVHCAGAFHTPIRCCIQLAAVLRHTAWVHPRPSSTG